MRNKKIAILLIAVLLSVFVTLSGCSTNSSKTYTFSVETGDSIIVSLDTTGNYDLSSELPFGIYCDGELLSQGTFIFGELYTEYVNAVESDENASFLDSGTKNGNEYVFWSYNDSEYNYVILIGNSSTGIILGNNISEESARECFSRLTIAVEE